MLGGLIILFVLFVAGPIALFFGGALWSALFGWMQSDHADQPKPTE